MLKRQRGFLSRAGSAKRTLYGDFAAQNLESAFFFPMQSMPLSLLLQPCAGEEAGEGVEMGRSPLACCLRAPCTALVWSSGNIEKIGRIKWELSCFFFSKGCCLGKNSLGFACNHFPCAATCSIGCGVLCWPVTTGLCAVCQIQGRGKTPFIFPSSPE